MDFDRDFRESHARGHLFVHQARGDKAPDFRSRGVRVPYVSRNTDSLSTAVRRILSAAIAAATDATSLSSPKGFGRKSIAPARMELTVIGRSPCPVIRMTGMPSPLGRDEPENPVRSHSETDIEDKA